MGNKTSKHKSKPNEFIIKHFQNNKENDRRSSVLSAYDERRIVFISLPGLCQSWNKVPSVSLYTALMILPLKKQWIYNPTEHIDALQSNLMSLISQMADNSEISEIIELLKWKESQGLVLWILDYFDDHQNPISVGNIGADSAERKEDGFKFRDPLIAKFWYSMNDKLTSLHDHITGTQYKPINLDQRWWRNKGKYMSKYDVKASVILSELYFLRTNIDAIREMIYQSNPKSLRPVIIYKSTSKIECPLKIMGTECVTSPLSPIKEPLSSLSTPGNDAKYSWACIQQHHHMNEKPEKETVHDDIV